MEEDETPLIVPSGPRELSPPPADPGSLGAICAILWVPDPEARKGWREFYVKRPEPPPEAKPGMGYPIRRSSRGRKKR